MSRKIVKVENYTKVLEPNLTRNQNKVVVYEESSNLLHLNTMEEFVSKVILPVIRELANSK